MSQPRTLFELIGMTFMFAVTSFVILFLIIDGFYRINPELIFGLVGMTLAVIYIVGIVSVAINRVRQ